MELGQEKEITIPEDKKKNKFNRKVIIIFSSIGTGAILLTSVVLNVLKNNMNKSYKADLSYSLDDSNNKLNSDLNNNSINSSSDTDSKSGFSSNIDDDSSVLDKSNGSISTVDLDTIGRESKISNNISEEQSDNKVIIENKQIDSGDIIVSDKDITIINSNPIIPDVEEKPIYDDKIGYEIIDEKGNIISSGDLPSTGIPNGYAYDEIRNEYVPIEDIGLYIYNDEGILVPIGKENIKEGTVTETTIENITIEGDIILNEDGTYTDQYNNLWGSYIDYKNSIDNPDGIFSDINGCLYCDALVVKQIKK